MADKKRENSQVGHDTIYVAADWLEEVMKRLIWLVAGRLGGLMNQS